MSTRSDAQLRMSCPGASDRDGSILAAIEALLFVAREPVDVDRIATALDWPVAEIEREVARLADLLHEDSRGIVVQRRENQVQLVTAPRFGSIVRRFLEIERDVRFSQAALETLAIIAFRQPVTRAEIETIRGVDCNGVLSTLTAREMIEVAGQRATIGNPHEYKTTDGFLRQFGIGSLDEFKNIVSD